MIRKPIVLPAPGAPAPRSFVHAPIAIEARPIGVLSAYSSTGNVYFSPEFVQFFRTLAVQLGLGLRNAQLYRELGDLSRELEEKVQQRTVELEDANRRLQELDRLKSDFVSTVSHELRTPLTAIRSLSESLLGAADMPRPRQEQFLGIIAEESQRLSRMINQLLDLSRIEAGKMEWRLEPVYSGRGRRLTPYRPTGRCSTARGSRSPPRRASRGRGCWPTATRSSRS